MAAGFSSLPRRDEKTGSEKEPPPPEEASSFSLTKKMFFFFFFFFLFLSLLAHNLESLRSLSTLRELAPAALVLVPSRPRARA